MTLPAYWLTFEDCPGYLHAFVQGLTDSLETSISFWEEIIAEAYERNVRRLLVREDFRNNIPVADMAEVNRYLAEQTTRLGMSDIRIAFLDERADQFDDNLAGELAAAEFGLCVKVFADRKQAEQWLLHCPEIVTPPIPQLDANSAGMPAVNAS